ncbi:MAG: methylenetetrahydrofolate--tRNA-(uracil(54)-C(5))-methyltransferase (FADH(2)-oxidizing) TrmFO [Hyphomicrobiales bacterium]
MNEVNIIGAGLAGSEAAWQLAERDIQVNLYEMRPATSTPAHKTSNFAELVCSNSFRSDEKLTNAVGILHEELRITNSLIMHSADRHQVPAGSALAVDRNLFSDEITKKIRNHKKIKIIYKEVESIPDEWEHVIIATGPLTSQSLSSFILKKNSQDSLYFFDAIAPIVYTETVDMSKAWFQSRYNKIGPSGSENDYINCPLNENQYNMFIDDLIEAEKNNFNDWEKDTPYFDSCLPIEIMALSGPQTLRHGPMKPFGLNNVHENGAEPYAVLQLRQDDIKGNLYNMVGFQTKIKYSHQTEIFRKIPGLNDAKFARLGGIHRNTYINSPLLLDRDLSLISDKRIKFAGQITGVEGYVESTSIGLVTALMTYNKIKGKHFNPPPSTSAIGSLIAYITRKDTIKNFQPMNVNFGLFDQVDTRDLRKLPKKIRDLKKKERLSNRALEDIRTWIQNF